MEYVRGHVALTRDITWYTQPVADPFRRGIEGITHASLRARMRIQGPPHERVPGVEIWRGQWLIERWPPLARGLLGPASGSVEQRRVTGRGPNRRARKRNAKALRVVPAFP